MNECPSFRATNACSDALPPTGIDYGNGLRFCVTNARIICKSKKGHCDKWTVEEGKMMASILIIYIRVIISWEFSCVIFNLGGTSASVPFFDAFDETLGTLSSAEKKFVRVMKDGTHVSNFDWRRLEVWKEPEEQIKAVSRSVKNTGRFLRNFFKEVAIPNSRTRGIQEPRGPSFFGTLVGDNERARYVQDKKDINYSKKLDELDGFFRNQRRESALASIVAQGFTVEEAPAELGRRGRVGALASIVAEGFTREEAPTILGRRGHDGAIASIVAEGFTEEEARAELGRRGRVRAIDSIVAEGLTREEALLELSRRQREGVINSIMAQGFTREEAISEWGS